MQVNFEKLDDQQIAEKIMRSLSARFDYVVAIIENIYIYIYIFTLTVEGLISSLCLHE